ncbi:MAG: rhomboid family intramembrane serine protease [Acidobacteria bacterium]|nr:rhomboid family intramembrane serine protease [Acidobacteriota bacterium]
MFILPVGHEKGTVRRLPWITFGIMALCFVVHLLFSGHEREQVQRILEARRNLAQFFYSNPQVELSADAQQILFGHLRDEQRRQYLEAVRGSVGTGPASRGMNEPGRQEELGRELARRVAAVHAAEKATTIRRWGLIPSHPSLTGLFGHMFLHGGWIHLLGNLFILYLAGPFIEDVWGRGVFAAFYILSGLTAAALFCLLHPGTNVPLIGASGAIAGVMGAFLVRYARIQIDFVYVFLFMGTGRFSAPALTMLPFWFMEQLFMSFMAEDSPGGGGVAYSAHVGGFVCGVGVALALKHYRVEERWLRPAIDKQVDHTLLDESALDQALALRAAGDVDAALTLMSEEARRRPEDRYLALAFWDVAGEENRAGEAAPALLALVRRELCAGQEDEAVDHWRKLLAAVPVPDADPALLVKIGSLLARRGEARDAAAAFRLALLDRGNRLTPALALALGRAARELDPDLARVAARWVMSRPGATEAARAGADTILADLSTTPPPR